MNNMDRLKARHLARITQCRTCRAPVVWFATKKGGRMPVDAETVKASDEALNLKYHRGHSKTCADNANKARK